MDFTPASVKSLVNFEEFDKLDIRLGTIFRTEDIEGMLFDIGYADGVLPVLAVPELPVPNATCSG